MKNAIYALACPLGEGGTLSLNENINVLTDDNVDIEASWKEALEKFCDEPVYKHYEENKKLITAIWGIAAAVVVGGLVAAACVATGGLAAGLVVAGSAALVGGISSVTNYALQKAEISITGEGSIDWYQVAIAGFGGAISGAVAASPLGAGGQIAVNGIIGGLQSFSTGGSMADITVNTIAGLTSGYLGGKGPDWKDTNIFVPHELKRANGCSVLLSTSSRARMTFKLLWKGLDSDKYLVEQFGGILSGYLKGLVSSNALTTVPHFTELLWEKYKPDWLKNEEEDEESYGTQ